MTITRPYIKRLSMWGLCFFFAPCHTDRAYYLKGTRAEGSGMLGSSVSNAENLLNFKFMVSATPTPMYLVSKEQIEDFANMVAERVKDELSGQNQAAARDSDEEQLIGYSEVSNLLGVGKTTLWRYIRDGKITAIRLSDKAVKFRKSEILKMMGV